MVRQRDSLDIEADLRELVGKVANIVRLLDLIDKLTGLFDR